MAKAKVAVIVGSLRKDSMNLKLGKAIAKLGAGKFDAQFVQIGDLPLFSQDLENPMPTQVARLKKEIEGADAVLFVTPEYNRGMPGPLKNAIDWASRPYGKNSFTGKPGALCGASPGAIGTACSQHNLRPTLDYLDVIVMGQPEVYFQFKEGIIDAEGNITSDNTKQFLQKFVDTFAAFVERHGAAQKKAQAA
ncbi:MAG TPA: NADPH-dependent FMN reductase [Patescibacteria group bacterium]|jgi:chromate reductase|nr:NADPH-dependent FMN reductase [Patescibacteria group bacterium]